MLINILRYKMNKTIDLNPIQLTDKEVLFNLMNRIYPQAYKQL